MLTALIQQCTRYAWLLLMVPLWAACAMVVDPDSLALRCELENEDYGSDPCIAVGLRCIEGLCQACDASAREICNGEDDDCDDRVDEGHDIDRDGFTWCGGGIVELADCVPSDGSIHPAAMNPDGTRGDSPKEACDGKDNDCDSKVDEDPKCAETKKCVETGCPSNQTCDVESGVCIVPREVGSGCTNDSDCKGGFCLLPGALFGLNVRLMDNRCASACCESADCDKGSVCLMSGTGARACLPESIVGEGGRAGGERCLRANDCASSLCDRGTCLARCFNEEGVCESNACALSPALNDTRTWLCAPPNGSEVGGERCFPPVPSTCRSGFCTASSLCAIPCGRDADCAAGDTCAYGEVLAVFGQASNVPMCTRPSTSEELVEQLCCTSEDCDDGELCSPTSVAETGWHMTCRKP